MWEPMNPAPPVTLYALYEAVGGAHAHEIPGHIFGKFWLEEIENFVHERLGFAHRKSAYAEAAGCKWHGAL